MNPNLPNGTYTHTHTHNITHTLSESWRLHHHDVMCEFVRECVQSGLQDLVVILELLPAVRCVEKTHAQLDTHHFLTASREPLSAFIHKINRQSYWIPFHSLARVLLAASRNSRVLATVLPSLRPPRRTLSRDPRGASPYFDP